MTSSANSQRSVPGVLPVTMPVRPSGKKRPQIAAIVTEYRRWSHAEHILDRFLWGYGWDGRHHYPEMDLVSLYVDQEPENDLSAERTQLFPSLRRYPTIPEALTRGGSKLAVDGVLLIGEHGRYETNEKGQKLYPRYEFFKEIVKVFRDSGRTAPVFNDKHLSWNWDWAKEMVDLARELDFPFMAGSSLSVVPRMPSVDLPLGAEAEEAVSVAVGRPDAYDIHSAEAVQTVVERRRGGESGVKAVQALQGNAVWELLEKSSWANGGLDPKLFEACLCRTHVLQQAQKRIFNHKYPTVDEMKRLTAEARASVVGYRIEYNDGFNYTLLMMGGLVGDFSFATRVKGRRSPISALFFLGPRNLCSFFSPLCNSVEKMFLTGKPTYPVERTLLTTGICIAGVDSLHQGQKRLETPHLSVNYQPTKEPTFRRYE